MGATLRTFIVCTLMVSVNTVQATEIEPRAVSNAPVGLNFLIAGYLYTGGRTTVNGVEGDTLQENTRLGATLALPLDRYNSVTIYASTGMYSRTDSGFDAVGIAWQYR